MTSRLRRAALLLLAAVVALLTLGVGSASAHVTVSSPDAATGGFGELTFRVPSESDTAKTTSLKVQLPSDTPFAFVSVQPVQGWTATTTTAPINPPITDDDGNKVTEAVTQVTWTADPGGGLAAGQYQSFSISAGPMPKTAGTLSFPALQGYDDGSTVSWIDPTVKGQPEPEHPAPALTVAASTDAAAATPPPSAARSTDSGTSGLTVTALLVGIAGLLVGAVGVLLALRAGRPTVTASAPVARERETADF